MRENRDSSIPVCIALTTMLFGAGLYSCAEQARAHTAASGMVYDGACCNGNTMTGDCQPIPTKSVRAIPGGYQITLSPGDHHMVTRVHVFQIEQAKVRWSTDGQFHACLWPNEDRLQCFYAPPQGA